MRHHAEQGAFLFHIFFAFLLCATVTEVTWNWSRFYWKVHIDCFCFVNFRSMVCRIAFLLFLYYQIKSCTKLNQASSQFPLPNVSSSSSSKKVRSSWELCWLYPLNWGTNRASFPLNTRGATGVRPEDHNFFNNSPKASASPPFTPNGFCLLISSS